MDSVFRGLGFAGLMECEGWCADGDLSIKEEVGEGGVFIPFELFGDATGFIERESPSVGFEIALDAMSQEFEASECGEISVTPDGEKRAMIHGIIGKQLAGAVGGDKGV